MKSGNKKGSSGMPPIIAELALSDNTVRYRLHLPRRLKKYFLGSEFFVRYGPSLDMGRVPLGILAIPLASVVAPIAWAVGTDFYVPELDTNYLQSLEKIKTVFRDVHYPFAFSGNIRVGREVTNKFGGRRTGVIFSGGVDSLTSYVNHRQEKPDIITILGVPDIPLSEHELLNVVRGDVLALAHQEGLEAFSVETDMITGINRELLRDEFGLRWYSSVIIGLTLNSLCAPVTASRSIGTLIRAVMYPREYETSASAHRRINESTFWADVKTVYDCGELSRQEKIKYLCLEENRRYLYHLHVCNDSSLAGSVNCGRCEKCLRTIAGLLLEGADPATCNFNMDAGILSYLRKCFEKGKIELNSGKKYMWADIQRYIPEEIATDMYGSRDFFKWLRTYDLSAHRNRRWRHSLWRAGIVLRGGRFKPFYIKRKIKCFFYIILARLKLI
jgi:hypothetical protein